MEFRLKMRKIREVLSDMHLALSLAVLPQLHTVTLEILLPDQTSTILPRVLKVSLLTRTENVIGKS